MRSFSDRLARRLRGSGARGPRDAVGSILVIVLLILSVLVIAIPILVMQTQTEAKWSAKGRQSTKAFHLAEAAIEKAYLVVTISTANWQTIMDGGTIAGYDFDVAYTDIAGGEYTIRMTSGTKKYAVEILAIGRDSDRREVRAIKAVYSKNPLGAVAIDAGKGVTIEGNNFQVEWGAVVTPKAIEATGKTYPQLWSASSVDLDTNGAMPPNCDGPNCCQWHSWNSKIPDQPSLDFDFYKSSAIATGTYFASGTNYCWNDSSTYARRFDPEKGVHYASLGLADYLVPEASAGAGSSMGSGGTTCSSVSSNLSGYTFYVDSNLEIQASGVFIHGNLIITGDLTLPAGNFGRQMDYDFAVPEDAWKQYCNDWSHYQTNFDTISAPASFPGIGSDYALPENSRWIEEDKIFVDGFIYVGGNVLNSGGGGNGVIVGGLVVVGSVDLGGNSQARIYYSNDVTDAIRTLTVILGRDSWEEEVMEWPL